jgi:hypothetical protein
MCLVLSPLWSAALLALDLDLAGFVVLLGVLPAAVRFGYGYLDHWAGGPASTSRRPRSDRCSRSRSRHPPAP